MTPKVTQNPKNLSQVLRVKLFKAATKDVNRQHMNVLKHFYTSNMDVGSSLNMIDNEQLINVLKHVYMSNMDAGSCLNMIDASTMM
jgi:hypothetical protein